MVTTLAFRPLRHADLPLLQRWLAEPHVKAWWREPHDSATVAAKYGPRIAGTEPTHVFVILGDGCPLGWIQWYRWADYPAHARLLGAPPDSAGLDLALGEAPFLGRGVGSQAIREFVLHVIFREPALAAVVTDPEARNQRSVRAFEKAGFHAWATVRLPGEPGDRQVMCCPRPLPQATPPRAAASH